jgi:hypothetical protein
MDWERHQYNKKGEREKRVKERTNGGGIIIICHELDLIRPVADPSTSPFKGLPRRLRGGNKELFLTKEEIMNEGKTEERKTVTKQKNKRKKSKAKDKRRLK